MCICGKEAEFSACCEPIILKTRRANSPEELMRSRYSAYATAQGEYLVYSSAKENRYAEDAALIEEFCNSVQWLKLDVLSAKENSVEFKAFYKDSEGVKVLHETSEFILEEGLWKYQRGELYNTKIQRNEPCPCGSGKKFKKCCGKNI